MFCMYWCVCVCCGICMCVLGYMYVCVYVCYVGACEERKPEQYYLGQDMPTYMSSGGKIFTFFHNITSEGHGGKNQHNKSYQ